MSRNYRFRLRAAAKFRRRGRRVNHSWIGSSYARRLHVEALEDRRMLAVFSVINLNDAGFGSLREAINSANANGVADTITFFSSATGQIDLVSQLPTITEDLTIAGPGAKLLTLDAGDGADNDPNTGDGYRLFNITDGNLGNQIEVAISGLTLTGGDVAVGDLFGDGGAIRNFENLTLTSSTLTGNAARGDGGAIYNFGITSIASSTLSNNSTAKTGGGVFNLSGTTNITSSTLSGNMASNRGGGISNTSSGTANISNSTLSDNSANYGGGVSNYNASATISSSTLSGNSATVAGGGISNYGGTADITSSTLSGNSAGNRGGGIFNINNASTTLNNTIVAKNTAVLSRPDVDNFSGTVSGTFNLIGDGTGQTGIVHNAGNNQVGTGVVPIDPLLGLLADNGGPTQTHALLLGSPAIDVGFSAELFDQRGAPFVRSDGDGVDIGALEQQTFAASQFVVTTTADELDYSNADVSLREAIVLANAFVGADTITFSPLFLNPQMIILDSQLPTIFRDLTITGPGADLLTLDADGGADDAIGNGDGYRLLNIDDGDISNQINVAISGLTLTGGDVSSTDLFGSGGAIRNRENLTVTSSTISGNSANGGNSSFGGGIFNQFGILTVSSSTLSGNLASRAAGIYNGLNGTVNITSSTISGNSATSVGGGIYNFTLGTVNITSSTITGNSASVGGGLRTFGPTTLNNTIVAGNNAVAGPSQLDVDGFVSGSFNLIGNGSGLFGIAHGTDSNQVGTNVSPIDPLLGPLADNG